MAVSLHSLPKREAAERTRQLQQQYVWLAGEVMPAMESDEPGLVLMAALEALGVRLRREEES